MSSFSVIPPQTLFNDRVTGVVKAVSSLAIKFVFISMLCIVFLNTNARAETVPPELRGSGLPLPRFVSIGSDKVFVRSGPAPRYPIKWVYKKSGLPVEVIEEFDVWRKVRDIDGDEGWVNKALLSDKRTTIIRADESVPMMDDPSRTDARVLARLEPKVIASVVECQIARCKLSTGGFAGWVERKYLWGLYPQEEIQ